LSRKRKNPIPIILFWSKREQKRFIDAVERFISAVGDIESLLVEPKRRAQAAAATRKANEAAKKAVEELTKANATPTPRDDLEPTP
jgi:hypothetical protein